MLVGNQVTKTEDEAYVPFEQQIRQNRSLGRKGWRGGECLETHAHHREA